MLCSTQVGNSISFIIQTLIYLLENVAKCKVYWYTNKV